MRFGWLLICSVVFSASAVAQSGSSEAESLKALVNEVHQLRQDLRTITVASQRVQIVLYRLQAQEAAVLRASQQLSDVRGRLADAQNHISETAAEIKRVEDEQGRTQNPTERRETEGALSVLRPRLEAFRKQEQQQQEAVGEAETQLRNQQRELDTLRGFLDQLDRVLEGLASPATRQ